MKSHQSKISLLSEKLTYFYKVTSISFFEFRLIVSLFSIIILGLTLNYSVSTYSYNLFFFYTYVTTILTCFFYLVWLFLISFIFFTKNNYYLQNANLNFQNLLKKLDSFSIWGTVVFNLWVISIIYMPALPFLAINRFVDSSSTTSYIFWLVVSLLTHVIFITLVWIDFKIRKYDAHLKKYSFLKLMIIPSIYLPTILIYGNYTGFFPYPFFNYTLNGFTPYAALIMYFPFMYWASIVFQNIFIKTQKINSNVKK